MESQRMTRCGRRADCRDGPPAASSSRTEAADATTAGASVGSARRSRAARSLPGGGDLRAAPDVVLVAAAPHVSGAVTALLHTRSWLRLSLHLPVVSWSGYFV